MTEKIITKSFERLLDRGKYRGFITYEELGKSLGKRNSTNDNIEKALLILADEKITFVEKNLNISPIRKKKILPQVRKKLLIKAMIQSGCTYVKWVV